MNVKIGEYKLIDSISIIGIERNPIEIQIGEFNEGNGEVPLTIVLNFKDDDNNKSSRIEYNVDGVSKLNINLLNINRSLGGGNNKIVKIGTYKGHELYYDLRIFTLENASKTIIVNFYSGKEVSNGQ